jgi:hypothetical protein
MAVVHSCDMVKQVVSAFTGVSLRLFAFNIFLIASFVNLSWLDPQR